MKTKNIKKDKKKWRSTLLLVLILAVALAAGITSVVLIRQSKEKDLSLAFDLSDKMYGNHCMDGERAPSFSGDICISENNMQLEDVVLPERVHAGLFNLDKGKTMYAQGVHEKIFPASITKIMTAILALKYGNLEDVVTITPEALNLEEGSTEIGFQPGDQVTMEELLHGLLISSGNDAAMTIAAHVGGTVEQFVAMMNEEAGRLGATNTHFENPTGLHREEHYTTVYDIYLMLNEALNYPEFVNIMQIPIYTMEYTRNDKTVTQRLDATDQYLTKQVTPPKHVTVLGGKTGTTNEAGACLALVSQNAYGEPFISIVVHSSTKAMLYENMNQLLSKINL